MSIIGTFPTTIANGQVEDATVVMQLFSWIQSQTNGNACPATIGGNLLKGDGLGGTTAAVAGTDYALPATLAAPTGASSIGFIQSGTEAVARTVQDKAREIVSIADFTGADPTGVTNSNAAFTSAEATAAQDIYVPVGTFLYTGTTALTKRYQGPGLIVSTNVSAVSFSGSGANDASVSGTYNGAYPIQILAKITNPATVAVATTAFSASGGIGTLSFAGGGTYPVGSWVEILGVSVTSGSISGKQYVLTASAGQVTFYTSATGSQTVAGTVQDFDEFSLSFNGGATFNATYQTYDPAVDNDKSVAYTVNTWASPLTVPVTASRIFGFVGLTIAWATSRGHVTGATWSFTLVPVPEKLFSNGNALYLNGARALTIESNRSVGLGSNVFGSFNSIGVENIGVGINALKNNTVGYANTAIGADALSVNETGGANIAISSSALVSNVSGNDNIAIGLYSQYRNISGSNNVSIGVDSLRQSQTGTNNVAVGEQSMYSVENGTLNTAVGYWSLRGGAGTFPSGITNNYCTAFGARSQFLTTNASYNTSVGLESLYQATGSYNTAIGAESGFQITTGTLNVFAGYNAGSNASQLASASYCVVLGRDAYTTGSNAIAIGSAVIAGPNNIAIGNSAHTGFYFYGNLNPQTDATQNLGNGGARFNTIYATNTTINTSDEREKQDIRGLNDKELAVAKRLKALIKTYRWKSSFSEKGDSARIHIGWIAQDVIAAFVAEGLDAFAYGCCCFDKWDDHEQIKAGDRYGVRIDQIQTFIISTL